jgi:hypothetical protein
MAKLTSLMSRFQSAQKRGKRLRVTRFRERREKVMDGLALDSSKVRVGCACAALHTYCCPLQ